MGKDHSVSQQTQAEPTIHWLALGTAGAWGSSLGPMVTDYREAGLTHVTELLVPWRKSPWSLRNPDIHRVERNEYELPGLERREGCSREREQQTQRPRGVCEIGGSEGSLVGGGP